MDWAPRIVTTRSGRNVGYRRGGNGPAVALLHASPRSSKVLVPLAQALSDRFTVFAFDNPGFGWSDPLAISRPDAADFGHALVETFDALGIASAPVYGSHTGAAMAVAAAIAHPDRVTALALDGYAVFTPAEQAESLANYLMPIRPEWDGTHLAQLWGRVKDQFTFYPWYLRGAAGRLPRGMVPVDLLQDVVVDFLAAGDDYRPAYAAAFRYPGAQALRMLTVPTTVMARTDDLLFRHLDRLLDMPQTVSLRPLDTDHAGWVDAVATALGTRAAGHAPLVTAATSEGVLRVPGGALGVTHLGAGSEKPLVLLAAIPGSAAGNAGLARALAVERPVTCIDLPGFGPSMLDSGTVPDALAQAIQQLGLGNADIVACEESAGFACTLAAGMPGARIVLLNPVADSVRTELAAAMVDVTPRYDGGHLQAAWHQLRDRSLWQPWYQRDTDHALNAGTDPDVPRLQAIMTDWMRGGTQGRATLAAALDQPLSTLTSALGDRLAILSRRGHRLEQELRTLAPRFALTGSVDDRGSGGAILHLLAA